MEEFAFQRYPPQNPTERPYEPTYPPQSNNPTTNDQDQSTNGGHDGSYAFGSGYGGSRGGGSMRGAPRGIPSRGRTPYPSRGGRGGRGYPPGGPGGYSRTYSEGSGQYNEREEWGSYSGPAAPSQPYDRPPQPYRGGVIVVRNLPSHVTEQDLFNHFGSAGMIKMDGRTGLPQIWLGPQSGEARISFQDPQVAENAVQWYNNGIFQGSMIHVEMARSEAPAPPQQVPPPLVRMGGRGAPSGRGDRFAPPRGGGFGGMRGAPSGGRGDFERPQSFEKRDGDWICANPDCQNTNFKWRAVCNRCKAPRAGDEGDFPDDMNGNDGGIPRGGRSRGYPMGGGRPMRRGGMRGFGGMGGSPTRGGRGGHPGSMRGSRGMMPDRGFRGRGGFPPGRGNNGNWRGRPY